MWSIRYFWWKNNQVDTNFLHGNFTRIFWTNIFRKNLRKSQWKIEKSKFRRKKKSHKFQKSEKRFGWFFFEIDLGIDFVIDLVSCCWLDLGSDSIRTSCFAANSEEMKSIKYVFLSWEMFFFQQRKCETSSSIFFY